MSGIVTGVLEFLQTALTTLGLDVLFIIALAVEAVLIVFFLVKSAFSYESSLNRGVDKLNYWLFQHKVITEDNVQEFNNLVKNVTPKRFCYYWQQYILYREGTPSSYMSTENVVDRPLKTSSYDTNIKNLNLISIVWGILMGFLFILAGANYLRDTMSVSIFSGALFIIGIMLLLNLIFTILLRARKNSTLNNLYQNISLFGRFMDNACIDLPTYIDYQILFTPQEIEKGQPVLREFLDYKTRKEKEEFQRAQDDHVNHEVYDFSTLGVSGSTILERAMKESEIYQNKKDKMLVQISQLETELDARKKNFDSLQKDYQTKLQASRENIDSLLRQQQETSNRIESNYLRKQQQQEIAKQEQLEQEFEQQRAKYILEKEELEEEVKSFQTKIEQLKQDVENIMLGEYKNFFATFCTSAEKVVGKVFSERFDGLKQQNVYLQQQITELEIRLKNVNEEYEQRLAQELENYAKAQQADYYEGFNENQEGEQVEGEQTEAADAEQPAEGAEQSAENTEAQAEGYYDEAGNYIYPNGSYYDTAGYFHDVDGKIYDGEGNLVGEGEAGAPAEPENQIVDLDSLNAFDFMTDVDMKDDIYGVAKNIINGENDVVTAYNSAVEDINDVQNTENAEQTEQETSEEVPSDTDAAEEESEEQDDGEKKPKKKAGRPKKDPNAEKKTKPKRKIVAKSDDEDDEPKEKQKRGRPKKNAQLEEINKKIEESESEFSQTRDSLNREITEAMNSIDRVSQSADEEKKNELFQEIERLQEEAKNLSVNGGSQEEIAEINQKIESLIEEVKKFNS